MQGTVKTTYSHLCKTFGAGNQVFFGEGGDDKVDAMFIVEAKTARENILFTVYSWKNGHIPTGEHEWHVGGFDEDALLAAREIIEGNRPS